MEIAYPYWTLMLCAAFAAVGAWLLYFFQGKKIAPIFQYGLGLLRFLVLFGLAVLLLKPVMKSVIVSVEKPMLLVGIDRTKSMITNDSAETIKLLSNTLSAVNNQLSEKYTVKTYSIGVNTQLDTFSEPSFPFDQSDLSSFLSVVNQIHTYDNVGAHLLISDGIYNSGLNPTSGSISSRAPLHVLGVGNPNPQIDRRVVRLETNQLAFVGNKFPVKPVLRFTECEGQSVKVVLKAFGKICQDTILNVSSDNQSFTWLTFIEAKEKGLQKVQINVAVSNNEKNTQNNSLTEYVRVEEDGLKVLLVYGFPHPDIATIRTCLQIDEGLDLKLMSSKEFESVGFNEIQNSYNLIIAFQIPTKTGKFLKAFSKLNEMSIPIWFMGNDQANYLKWTQSDAMLSARGHFVKSNEVQALVSNQFSLFDAGVLPQIVELPPLKVPFGHISISAGAHTYLYQSVGGINTTLPLWVFTESSGGAKRAYLFGEGIWRWQLYGSKEQDIATWLQQSVINTVKYLAAKKDLSRFRVTHKKLFSQSEEVMIYSELYNPSFQIEDNAKVVLHVKDSNNLVSEYEATFSNGKYEFSILGLKPGSYSYTAKAKIGTESFAKKGVLEIQSQGLEYANTQANFQVLNAMASKNGGEFFELKNFDQLVLKLEQLPVYNQSIEEPKFKELIDEKWLFILLVLLLSIEWFLRKREGVV
jgi:hypothetical protein